MKKIVSGVLSLILAALSFAIITFSTVAPASANTGSIGYCQATNSDRNPFNFITASIDSLLDSDGNFKQSGVNVKDIVPKFSYINKASVRRYFEGQNTSKETLTAADCPGGPKLTLAEPNDPTYVLPSCANPSLPYGKVVLPKDLGLGVASASDPVLDEKNKQFSLFYTLQSDTKTEYFQWADVSGETKNYILNAKHISEVNDPLYIVDEKTKIGECQLSNTGFMGLDTKLTIVGGVIGLGILVLIGSAIIRRKTA